MDCTPACVIGPSHPACQQCGSPSTAEQLLWDSVNAPGALLDYPGTKVHMIFGRQDCTSAVPMGLLWYDAITSARELQFIHGTPHFTAGTPQGREAIRRAIDLGTPAAVGVEWKPETPPVRIRVTVSPNPSAGTATFTIELPSAGSVSLGLYDLGGRRVASLHEGALPAGRHAVTHGAGLPAGVYFWRLRAGSAALGGTFVRRE
jgi:hypothetical protein